MHFVINMFIALVCLATVILFKEVLKKWIQVIIGLVGCGTFSYAIAILIKKCGEWFSWWSGDAQYIKSNFIWICPIVIVITIIIMFIINKKNKKQA